MKGGGLGHELDLLYDSHIRDDFDEPRVNYVGVGGGLPRAPYASALVRTSR
jgi:hypothetical protein